MTNNTAYAHRPDLTAKEIRAISHYKDLINKQYKWKHQTPEKPKTIGIDCYMVNSILRRRINYHALSKMDKKRLDYIIKPLISAIQKSRVTETTELIKGLKPFDGLKDFKREWQFTDTAFGSFTTSIEKAEEYAGENDSGEIILYTLTLEKGDKALYIDSDEEEWILPPNQKYHIEDIFYTTTKNKKKAIIYHLKLTT